MNKAIFIKAGIVLGAFILMLGLAFGCTAVKNNDKTPLLTDGDDVYVTIDGVEVTNQELYEEMIISSGLSYLLQYAEEQLMVNYLANVTDEELLAEKELLTYGTDDPIVLALYKADTIVDEQLVETFESTMILLGLDPNDVNDLRIYLGLSVAKQTYTREYLLGVESTDPLYISDEDVQVYYEANTVGDVYTIDVRFNSETEAELVLNEFNIVPNYDGVNWGLYDPSLNSDIAIDAVETDGFNDTNTAVLTEDEVFDLFVEIYNYMNPLNILDTELSQADFMTTYEDMVRHNYEDMTRTVSSTSDAVSYVDYIFTTLSLPDEDETTTTSRYSYTPQAIGEFAVLAYKLSEDTVAEYVSLSDAEKAELREELLDSKLTTTSLEVAMEELWIANELVIYEPTLKLQSKFQEGIEYDNNGSTDIVATLGDKEITPKILFEYMTENFGLYSALEVAETKALLQSDLYNTVYDGDQNYLKSDNATMMKHIEDLEGFKQYFASDGFATYNLSSADYSWEEFIVLYLQCSSEMDVLEDISIAGNLQNYLVQDTINYEAAVAYIQDQVDNYFSLNVEHILLFVDNDYDFAGDDYSDYLDALTVDEKVAYDALMVSFSSLVQDKVTNDEMTLAEIVTEYQDSLIGDETNVWAPFKEAGFFIVTQNLSSENSLTYTETEGYFDEAFVTNVKRAYDAYVLEIAQSIEEPAQYNDNQVFATDFGVHYIIATKGTNFEQPTAVFDNADEDYVAGNVGTTIAPNKAQVELYVDIAFSKLIVESNESTLASSVSDSLDAYYAALYDLYWPSTNNTSIPVTIVTVTSALENGIVFADNNVERLADLQTILDTLIETNFPETFITE